MPELRLRLNGPLEVPSVQPQVSLLDALREYLRLTGTKKGCDLGAWGACLYGAGLRPLASQSR